MTTDSLSNSEGEKKFVNPFDKITDDQEFAKFHEDYPLISLYLFKGKNFQESSQIISYWSKTVQMHFDTTGLTGGSKFDRKVEFLPLLEDFLRNNHERIQMGKDDRQSFIDAGLGAGIVDIALYYRLEGVPGSVNIVKLDTLPEDGFIYVMLEKAKGKLSFSYYDPNFPSPKTNSATLIFGKEELTPWTLHPGDPVRPFLGNALETGIETIDQMSTSLGDGQALKVPVGLIRAMPGMEDKYVKVIHGLAGIVILNP